MQPLWRGPLLVACALAAATGLITSNAWADIFHLAWVDEESSHVLLVPVIVAWLVWVRRKRFQQIEPALSLVGPILLVAGWMMWSLGYRFQVQICWHGGAVLMLIAAVVTAFGKEFARAFLPAITVMVFLVPIPATGRLLIAVPLQRLTAMVTQNVAEVAGLEMQRQGSILILDGQQVAVAEACNGMRMVFTLFLASYAAAFVTPLRNSVRVLILALSPVTAVVCNVVRLVPTVWVFAHASSGVAETFHSISGWLMLVLAFAGLIGVARLLAWAGVRISRAEEGTPVALPSRLIDGKKSIGLSWACAGISLAALVAAGTVRLSLPKPRSAREYHQRVRSAAEFAPMQIGSWTGRDTPMYPDAYGALRPNIVISRNYVNTLSAEVVDFLLVQCSDVRDLAPHYPPACYPARGLTLTRSWPRDWTVNDLNVVGMEYEFESNEFLRDDPIVVENFMVLPTGKFGRDPSDLRREIGLRNRYFGAAEVQIVFGADVPAPRRDEIVQLMVSAYRPLLDVIRSGSQE